MIEEMAAGGEDVDMQCGFKELSAAEGRVTEEEATGRADTCMQSGFKELVSVELGSPAASHEKELPWATRNLSPRLSRSHGPAMDLSLLELNIDQATELEQGFTQVKVKGMRAKFPSDRQLRSSTSSQNSFNALTHD